MKEFKYKDSFVAVREWETGIIPKEMQRTCFCCGDKQMQGGAAYQ